MIEEGASCTRDIFERVGEKVGQLALSKLHNLSQTTLRQIQDRLNGLERKVVDQIAITEA